MSAVFVKSMGELLSGCGTSVGICANIVEVVVKNIQVENKY